MKGALPHERSLTIQLQIYKRIHRFFNVYMTHLLRFVLFCSLVRVLTQLIQIFVGTNKIIFFFFAYSPKPLLDNVNIYTSIYFDPL